MSSSDPLAPAQVAPDPLRDSWHDPFDWYREMHQSAPVEYDPDRRCWDVFPYEEANQILDNPQLFTSEPTQANDVDPSEFDEHPPVFETMLLTDPP